MVNKLNDNLSYLEYIRKKMREIFPDWEELEAVFENQPNNNFQIDFSHLCNKISFIKDKGLLHLSLYQLNNYNSIGNVIYDSILINIPEQDSRWRLSICTELIDYYIIFLMKNYNKYFD